MLRVPVEHEMGGCSSLIDAKNQGADIRPISSPQEVSIALEEPRKVIVFFAVGFETTMAPIAATLLNDLPNNFKVLLSGRLTWPAVAHVLESQPNTFDALIAWPLRQLWVVKNGSLQSTIIICLSVLLVFIQKFAVVAPNAAR